MRRLPMESVHGLGAAIWRRCAASLVPQGVEGLRAGGAGSIPCSPAKVRSLLLVDVPAHDGNRRPTPQ